jgi:hypothetical protein
LRTLPSRIKHHHKNIRIHSVASHWKVPIRRKTAISRPGLPFKTTALPAAG